MPPQQQRRTSQRSSGRSRGSAARRPRSLLATDLAAPAPRRQREVREPRPARRPAAHGLPREREYAFIRSDLRRLLVTAAIVTVLMLTMLIVLD